MVEERAVNASQAFYYCKLMVMICKEAMAGNHFLRSCKPVCNWIRFVYCPEWQVLISMQVNTKRECCW